jgi:hypothetical protein
MRERSPAEYSKPVFLSQRDQFVLDAAVEQVIRRLF